MNSLDTTNVWKVSWYVSTRLSPNCEVKVKLCYTKEEMFKLTAELSGRNLIYKVLTLNHSLKVT